MSASFMEYKNNKTSVLKMFVIAMMLSSATIAALAQTPTATGTIF